MDKKRIQELEKKISRARHLYYNAQPEVSDAVFDAWIDELAILDPTNKQLVIVGSVPVSKWEKAKHSISVKSLNKVNAADEFRAWAKDCDNAKVIFLTEKLDGISINTIWKDGVLVQAITRGDGNIGEDITQNVKKMKGIPKKLKKNFSGSLRGEIILLKSDHKKHFPDYANPRNAASGIAKRYDGEGSEHLTVLMYQVSGVDFQTEKEQFDYICSLGTQAPHYNVYKDVDSAIKEYNRYAGGVRDQLDYEIDGMVGRVNDMMTQLALGDMGRGPKGAIAFKFAAETRETTLRKIVWQVGPTGRLTPVAEFDPVQLVGATVSRSSLYNYSYVRELGCHVGCKIIVSRANDVIPRVEEVSSGTGVAAGYPHKCPECNGQVAADGEYLLCTNKQNCPAQALGRLKMWIKENNILEWGDKVLKKALDAGLVSDVGDLYRLTTKQLAGLDRMGEKSAQNLVDVLDKHREIPLENFVGGLGIEGVATSTTKLIITAGYDTLDEMKKLSASTIEGISGFGEIRAKAFVEGLRDNSGRIKDILNAGVKIKARVKGALTGKTFCFTGSMRKPRPVLQKMVEENGGDVKKSVGRGLHYLVIADPSSASSKAQAARKLGTKLISEDEFVGMCS